MGGRLLAGSAAAAAVVALAAIPLIPGTRAISDLVVFVYAYGLLALSLNLLIGYTGMVSFGHAMFFGVGAYAFALGIKLAGLSVPSAFVLAILAAMLLAAGVGAICIRLNDVYFAFVTLAFQMFVYSGIVAWRGLTGGDDGLVGGIPRQPFWNVDLADPLQFHVAVTGVFGLCVLLMWAIVRSPFGAALRMVRDNPRRAAFLGLDVPRLRLSVFVLSAGFAAAGGVILALFASGAYPGYAHWTTSGSALFMIVIGGASRFLGPLLGALALQLLSDVVDARTEHHGLVVGAIILAITLGSKNGLSELGMRFAARGRRLLSGRSAT